MSSPFHSAMRTRSLAPIAFATWLRSSSDEITAAISAGPCCLTHLGVLVSPSNTSGRTMPPLQLGHALQDLGALHQPRPLPLRPLVHACSPTATPFVFAAMHVWHRAHRWSTKITFPV